MKKFYVQMLDNTVNIQWWNQIMEHFIHEGDYFEIRCWEDELEEIRQASLYGVKSNEGNLVSIKGKITGELLEEILKEEPSDKDLYNKMTKYFTINASNAECAISSAHYGTELYISIEKEKDVSYFQNVMNKYPIDFFSISEWE